MKGDLLKTMRHCPQPVIAALDRMCAGAGAAVAMARDLRVGTARSKTAFLFNRGGLAACDMGAYALLPRIVGPGRASEWGFFNRLVAPEVLAADALDWARQRARGPSFASGITKTMLHQEWNVGIDQAIEAEAQAQALCMLTEDFGGAYRAFVARDSPVFECN